MTIEVFAVLALLVGPPPRDVKPRPRPDPAEQGRVADFSLLERSRKTVTRADLEGKVWIASFVLTRCPDGKCPQVTQTIQRLQKELPDAPDLLFVTFTVDPKDDPGELDRYARRFDANPGRWLFLTGSEEEIDRVMRSFHFPSPKTAEGSLIHAQKLVVVDREGKIRGYYDGLDDSNNPEGYFEEGLTKLRRQVRELLAPAFPFPAFNATLNGISAALIFLGWVSIRARLVRLHIACMLSALLVSAVFLASYLFYHLAIKGGEPTPFTEQAPGAPDWVRQLYYAVLLSHTILAVIATPLALYTAYLGLRNKLAKHTRIARWTMPIWLYVSVTGVVVYWMLYRLYPAG